MKVLYSISEVIEANGGPIPMSKSGVYDAIRKGAIAEEHIHRIGNRVFIKKSYIEKIS